MTIRVDSSSLIAGKTVVSLYAGHGIPASQIPSTGTSGPGYLFNDIATQGAVSTDEMRGEILTWPTAGTLTVNEDSSFSFTGAPSGSYSFTYRGYRNGVSYGDFTVNLIIGAGIFDAVAAYTVPSRTFAAQVSAAAPAGVSASVSYIVSAPVFSAQAVPVAPSAYSATIAISITAPVFSASATSIAAQPINATVSYQVKAPAFSVTAQIAGSVVYIPDGALIVEKTGSNWMNV